MRRFILLLLISMLSVNLVGCNVDEIKAKIESEQRDAEADKTLSESSKYAMTQESYDLVEKAKDANYAYLDIADTTDDDFNCNVFLRIGSWITGNGFTNEGRREKALSKAEKKMKTTKRDAARALESDEVYAASKEAATQETESSNDIIAKIQQYWWLIAIVVVVLLLIILLSKKKQPPVTVSTPAPTPQSAPVIINSTSSEPVDGSSRVDVNKEKALKDWCRKADLDADATLAQCNGNMDQAINMAMDQATKKA